MSDSPPNLPRPSPWPRLGRALLYLLVPVLVAMAGWRGFHYLKLRLAIAHAQQEFLHRQFMRAEFWAGRALRVDVQNVAAARIMAEINEAQDKPQALRWRIRVAQLAPGSTADIMAWAKSAFRFGQREMAVTALKSLPPDFQKRSAECQELLAGCALARGEMGLAEEYFVRAAALGGDNPVHRINLAAFRLTNAASTETRSAATRELEAALNDPQARLLAARALLGQALRAHDRAAAQRLAEKLRACPDHNFDDELLGLAPAIGEPAFRPALKEVERAAAADVTRAIELGNWLNTHGMAAETLRCFAALPAQSQANVRVQITAAEAHLALADWAGLEAFLAGHHWDDGEYLRRAMLVCSLRERSLPWEKEWSQLAGEVKASALDSFLLGQMVMAWNWRKQALDLLWAAATRPETNAIALQALRDAYARAGDTREMLRVVKAQRELDPANPARKNNEAFLSLLLYGPSEHAERLASEACATNPNLPEWAATYAYALHLRGKEAAAKEVLDRLPAEALSRPGIALYEAIVQAANGDSARARESLARLNPNGLLPEERKLATDLAQQLNVASR